MATIGDMLRSKGIKKVGNLVVAAGRPTHLTEMQPRDLVKLGFVVVDDRATEFDEEEARLRREDPIGADIMDQVFEMAAAEQEAERRRRLSEDLMDCLLLDEEAEELRRYIIEMGCGDPEH